MAKSSGRAGGGINSNKLVKPGVRTGQAAREMRPAGVSQYGGAYGNHATEGNKILRGAVEPVPGTKTPAGGAVPLGNEVALNVGKGGAGTGRTVYGSGTNKTYGPVAGTTKPAGREILNEFGPDSPGVRGRK